jgi:hypothetical protein
MCYYCPVTGIQTVEIRVGKSSVAQFYFDRIDVFPTPVNHQPQR